MLLTPILWVAGFLRAFVRSFRASLMEELGTEPKASRPLPFALQDGEDEEEKPIDFLSDHEMRLLNHHEQQLREGRRLWH
jgi:hypothetical protein